jgi:glycosyltransferase involved in cell wall biosynthesis
VPERDFPIQYHIPILPLEVMAVGKCLILSKELNNKQYYGNLIDQENVFLVDPKNITQFHIAIEQIVKNPDIAFRVGKLGYENSRKIENFDEFMVDTIKLYSDLVEKNL